MINGGEQLLVSHLRAALAALTVITSADACMWKEKLGTGKEKQRWVHDFAFVYMITVMSACLCKKELVKIGACQIQVPSVLPWRTELCLNDSNGAKRAGLIYHAFKDTKDKTDKQGLDKVTG